MSCYQGFDNNNRSVVISCRLQEQHRCSLSTSGFGIENFLLAFQMYLQGTGVVDLLCCFVFLATRKSLRRENTNGKNSWCLWQAGVEDRKVIVVARWPAIVMYNCTAVQSNVATIVPSTRRMRPE